MSEIARSKRDVALNKAEQWSDRNRDRRLIEEARRLKATFEELRAVIRKTEADAKERRETGQKVVKAFEKVMKFYARPEVREALPAEAGRVIRTAREIRGQVDVANPAVPPIDAMLVMLVFAAAAVKKRFAAGSGGVPAA
jgi:hypothetical protein